MATLRWGLLSTARINDRILAAAQASEAADVAAVASRNATHATTYAASRGIPRAYGGYEALLADPDIDAVYVSLPNHLHVEWTIRALEAGKHVLCEKPLSRRLEEATRAFDVAGRAGLILSEGFMWRHNPQTLRLVELVAQGAIGEVRRVRAVFGFELALAGPSTRRGPLAVAAELKRRLSRLRHPLNIRLVPGYEGGALMDVGCYCVSAARLLAGEPSLAEGTQVIGPTGVDIRFAGRLELPDGVEAQFECGLAMGRRDELEVVGSQGSLFVDDPFLCVEPGIELRDGSTRRIEVERADSYRLQLENLRDAVAGTAPLLLGRDDALGQARALEALYRSADQERPLRPPDGAGSGLSFVGASEGGGGDRS